LDINVTLTAEIPLGHKKIMKTMSIIAGSQKKKNN